MPTCLWYSISQDRQHPSNNVEFDSVDEEQTRKVMQVLISKTDLSVSHGQKYL